ncbi:MarR family winged helix-turn-helix transcriptional regulator [Paraburkholderia fungorum]|uniref:MarR family winged helix-turn-helix transcriptional regulator n=1 Tax=Paraburkholderia fungorum TaxID=134537 RepID=UPI00209837D0|nr:MarR family transcriptional regulator [Paraburkholderia fungorum]USX11240.1 MarR family transcriptional regulator [Paraburkholderia fungorum]
MYSDFLTFRLDLTSELLINRANAVYRERWNLDVRALRVLRLVCAEPDITPKEVSQRALVEKTLLSKVLADLEMRGLISRDTHPVDRRSVALRATDDGFEVARSSEVLGKGLEGELVKALTASERKVLEKLLDKLAHSLLRAESP